MSKNKTHIVLDLTYLPDEGQDCFEGTQKECHKFVEEQSQYSGGCMYQVVPMTKQELDAQEKIREIEKSNEI